MDAVRIVIVLEVAQRSLEVGSVPEGNMIQIVSADRADELLDMNGCESGTEGTVFISSISRIRRFAFQR